MENKQGMSAIITTLIIILLVIIALGIIWVVVKNVIQGGVEQIELSTKCREVEIQATRLVQTSPGNYSITLSRTGMGETIGGIKVVLANTVTNEYSNVTNFGGDYDDDVGVKLSPLDTKTRDFNDTGVEGANKIEITVWFLSDLEEEELCPITVTKEF